MRLNANHPLFVIFALSTICNIYNFTWYRAWAVPESPPPCFRNALPSREIDLHRGAHPQFSIMSPIHRLPTIQSFSLSHLEWVLFFFRSQIGFASPCRLSTLTLKTSSLALTTTSSSLMLLMADAARLSTCPSAPSTITITSDHHHQDVVHEHKVASTSQHVWLHQHKGLHPTIQIHNRNTLP